MVISREMVSYTIFILLSVEDWFLYSAGSVLSDVSTVSLESLQDCSPGLTHVLFVTNFTGDAVN